MVSAADAVIPACAAVGIAFAVWHWLLVSRVKVSPYSAAAAAARNGGAGRAVFRPEGEVDDDDGGCGDDEEADGDGGVAAMASGIGGGDAAEVVAKALSRPAATPSLPRRTRKATTAALGGQIEDDGVGGQIKEEEPLRGKGGEGRAVAVVRRPRRPTPVAWRRRRSHDDGVDGGRGRLAKRTAAEVVWRRRGQWRWSRLATAWTTAAIAADDGAGGAGGYVREESRQGDGRRICVGPTVGQ
ncbi:hypothetical protein OsI_01740 [Oryza sativa Indica Group]|uniref:Uncharacterized protein n=1 Tax=Oryza sativa subsp. indica TaxID=39946 RepID=B8A7G6_ORYSI|nr:hypothetical protein OsI_01740 [Oryza sativa Indica Group]